MPPTERTETILRVQTDIQRVCSELDKNIPRPERHPDVAAFLFLNGNGSAIAVVAVQGRKRHISTCDLIQFDKPCDCVGQQTWCAYIGATSHSYYEEDAINFARSHGSPFPEKAARALFPQFDSWAWEKE